MDSKKKMEKFIIHPSILYLKTPIIFGRLPAKLQLFINGPQNPRAIVSDNRKTIEGDNRQIVSTLARF